MGTLACAGFVIVIVSVAYWRSAKPHRQECLCYSRLQIHPAQKIGETRVRVQ